MKTKLIFFGLLCFKLSFGQNLSLGNVLGLTPVAPNEIFRFQPGNVTQLDDGTNFNFTNSRWFSVGKVETGANIAYGLRFQLPNRALLFGYQSVNDVNPRIQWIGRNSGLGNLEFRVASAFNNLPNPGPAPTILVATMDAFGSTIFGDPSTVSNGARVVIANTSDIGFKIESLTQTHGVKTGFLVNQPIGTDVNIGGNIIVGNTALESLGLNVNATLSNTVVGIRSVANDGAFQTIGVFGAATPDGNNGFAAGIYGSCQLINNNQWAGYFNGRIFASNFTQISDRRLKLSPIAEEPLLPRLALLKPVTYKFIKTEEFNLPTGLQHGFIAQDVEQIFPEMVSEINKPILDKNGKITGTSNFKTVDYIGMISMLVGGIQELNEKITKLESQLAERSEKSSLKTTTGLIENSKSAFINQNIPNPFSDQTTISYQLPEGTNAAEIMITDLNGRMIKTYPINKNQSELTIKASEIGSGLFIYSLVQNGQELLSKKMVVK